MHPERTNSKTNSETNSELLTVGSLFAGIGGFDYGLESTGGFRTVWQVENNPFCNQILAKHWPDVKRYQDVKEIKPEQLERVDLICGGFPCQPASQAGKRKGTDDDRWLWPEFIRIVRSVRPKWVLAENVPGLLSVNSGRAFGEVVRDLAASGYSVQWDCISAAAVGAPHIRDRVWIVAYSLDSNTDRASVRGDVAHANVERTGRPPEAIQTGQPKPSYGSTVAFSKCKCNKCKEFNQALRSEEDRSSSKPGRPGPAMADANGPGLQRHRSIGEVSGAGQAERPVNGISAAGSNRRSEAMANANSGRQQERNEQDSGASQPGQQASHRDDFDRCYPGLFDGRPGLFDSWQRDPASFPPETKSFVGRVVDGIPHRVDRLRALGNAVVPQVVHYIGHRILAHHHHLSYTDI